MKSIRKQLHILDFTHKKLTYRPNTFSLLFFQKQLLNYVAKKLPAIPSERTHEHQSRHASGDLHGLSKLLKFVKANWRGVGECSRYKEAFEEIR